jgi:hypothetical protein
VSMKNNRMVSLGFCMALSAFGSMAADDVEIPASAANDRPAAPADPQAVPAPRTYNGIRVINSGADLDQVTAIKHIASQYKLRLEMSDRGGEYRVAERLQLMQRGQVITQVSDAGPWLLLDVPSGPYTLVADFADRQVTRDITVADSGTTVHWVVPSSVN